jgi:hypothetical protein
MLRVMVDLGVDLGPNRVSLPNYVSFTILSQYAHLLLSCSLYPHRSRSTHVALRKVKTEDKKGIRERRSFQHTVERTMCRARALCLLSVTIPECRVKRLGTR